MATPDPVQKQESFGAFQKADLGVYTPKQRFLIRAADIFFYLLIGLIGWTLRYEVEGNEMLEKYFASETKPILVFWHDRIFASTYFFRRRKIVVMSSKSFDGEYMARFIQRFGYGAARGSSTRGGLEALVKMVRLMRRGFPAGFTIDGPKGPRYIAKPGACLLAKKTGNPLIPFVIEVKRFFELHSWDKLQIPFPFTKAKVFVGNPIFVDETADENTFEQKHLMLQQSLDELVRRGVQWRTSKD